MGLLFETRTSASPWVSTVWTCRSAQVSEMTSVASETWGLVLWEERGSAHAAVVGPESRTARAPVPQDASFVGIQFAVGASLRMSDMVSLVDGGIALPDARPRSFWLDGRRWPTPRVDDAELLVDRLVRHEVLVRDPVVSEMLRGRRSNVSPRTVERRFRAATGMTRGSIAQIERARAAAELLTAGATAGEVVERLDFYDEPHLARALRRYIGRSAQQLRSGSVGTIALDPDHRTTS
ncbi:helix-turn-helix domain-containing protein [Microbacterium sp. gxy059]|uniref:helix-turn-helix domain-containing protein n=1 Tax=Microbacterium sp. gxy059 TaxID=2957199 RepID=UPI003D9984CB